MHFLRSLLLATIAVSPSFAVPVGSQQDESVAPVVSSPLTRDVSTLDSRGGVRMSLVYEGVKYNIWPGDELGRGAFGAVYEAEIQPGDGRPVALKEHHGPPNIVTGNQFVHDNVRDFSNVIKVHIFGNAGNSQYVVMEKAAPQDMEEYIQAGRYHGNNRIIKSDFMDLVRGMGVLHSSDLSHNDGHSGNVVFVRGVPKWTDFDLVLEGRYQDRICGRMDILSPEALHLTRSPAIDAFRNDVWALGVTLFRMITGTNPWRDAQSSIAQDIWMSPSSRERANLLKSNFPMISFDVCKVLANVFTVQRDRYSTRELYRAISGVDRFYSSRSRKMVRAESTDDEGEDELDTPQNYLCPFNPDAGHNGTAPKTSPSSSRRTVTIDTRSAQW